MNKVRAEERALVENYAWVDQKAGIARIPVGRALEILAERGLPKVAAPAPVAGAPPNTFVPVAGKRDMAGPPVSTGESPGKAGAPEASGTKPEAKPAAKASTTSEAPKKEAKP